jgi:hypothetical protein
VSPRPALSEASLSAAERRLWAAFAAGRTVDLRAGQGADGQAGRDADDQPRPVVRAEVIIALAIQARPAAASQVSAVRLVGADIIGDLDLAHADVAVPLTLRGCRFQRPVALDYACTRSIDLRESSFSRLTANGLRVVGYLDLRDAVVGEQRPGPVSDPVDESAVDPAGPGQLRMVGAQIEGDFYAGGIKVHGKTVLVGTQIGGVLTLRYAELRNPDDTALDAGGLSTGRDLLLNHLHADGEVRLPGARIRSVVRLSDARLSNPSGRALTAEALVTESDFVAERLTTRGSVMLNGAAIGGGLYLDAATLQAGTDGRPVIRANRMTVGRSLYLRDGLQADGEMRFVGMRVSGHMDLIGMRAPGALLSLYGAHVGDVRDAYESWPASVNLDGFSYGGLSHRLSVRQRLDVLGRQHAGNVGSSGGYLGGSGGSAPGKSKDSSDRFRAQPYEQLAAHYRGLGSDSEARIVLLAKQRARRRTLRWPRRLPGYLLDGLVGYGYRPLRAVGWGLALLAAGTAYFSGVGRTYDGTGPHPPFSPFLYTLDQLVPVGHFGQQDSWQVHGLAAYVAVGLTVFGWSLGLAVVAAVSRTLTRT